MANFPMNFDSKLIHGGGHKDAYGSATIPIYQTSTFAFENADHGARCFAGESDGFIYTRIGNPTISALERLVADLEGGSTGVAVASGMAAVSTIYMTLLEKGAHIISSACVYGPSRVLMEQQFHRFGVESSYVNTSDFSEIEKALRPNTKVLFLETPANPTMDLVDLEKCAAWAKSKGIITVVDNTFCSPVLQKPLALGIDVVFHSMTKFLNGHADVVAGIVVTKDEALGKKMRTMMVNMGCNMDPHQAFLVLRGLKTLTLRVEKSQQNAMELAQWLSKHPKVSAVRYPGLESHPQYALARKQMAGGGSTMTFELKGGIEAGKTLMNNVKLIILAVSLGGVESLISHPASMTHSKMSKESRAAAGITDGLVRFAVGIEDIRDIKADLEQALALV